MPYLRCPNCNVTSYVTPAEVRWRQPCPLCDAPLDESARLMRLDPPAAYPLSAPEPDTKLRAA